MALTPDILTGLASALGLGILVGIDRERSKDREHPETSAGVRTHALLALSGAVAMLLGPWVVAVTGLCVMGLIVASYFHSAEHDAGLTGEVAALLVFLLGALAIPHHALAAGLGVLTAVLLAAKPILHRLTREWLTQDEMRDLLVLAASGLIVLPLLPAQAVDPWGVIRPAALGKLALLVMGIGAAGHLALRIIGARWGLVIAGFLAGFASSTAATAGFGQRAKATPTLLRPSIAAALFANLASLMVFAGILGAASLTLLQLVQWPLLAGGAVLAVGGAMGVWHAPREAGTLPQQPTARAFRLSQALIFVAIVATMLLLSAWLNQRFGSGSVLLASTFVALADQHAAAAGLGQIFNSGTMTVEGARWGVVALLAAASIAKSAVAIGSGGWAYGLRITVGLMGMLLAVLAATWFLPLPQIP